MRIFLLAFVVTSLPLLSASATPSPAEARRILRYPSGSLSLGFTNSGKLLNGVKLPVEGRGFRIFSHFVKRDTNFGTAELIGLIKRAGRTVSKTHPGAIIGVGNLSREGGGQTGSSVSHKSGRDADLGMFALTRKGEAKNLGSFISFEKDGWDKRKRYRFDPVRNLDLVLALVEDTQSPVQVIFVADWLKAIVMKEATRRGLDAEKVQKIDTILRQPSDSNPHHHHYHVRLYCSLEDRQHGCLERGDVHPWVDHGEDTFQKRVEALTSILSMKQTRWRRAGVERLGELRAVSAIGPLLRSAEDTNERVALAALAALGNMAHPDAFPPLVELLERSSDAKRIIGILDAILRIELPELERTSLAFMAKLRSESYAGSTAQKRILQLKTLEVLQRFGRKASFEPVLKLLDSEDIQLMKTAHRTLRRITNQPIKGSFKRQRHRNSLREKWVGFRNEHQDKSWYEWMILGFKARGITTNADGKEHPESLVEQLTHRDDDAAHNAALTLMHLTGHTAYPWWRKKRNNHRHWKSWFRTQGGGEKLP